jgi:hypothetical protein
MPEKHWRQLYQYWLSKWDGDRPPSRADIDPLVDIPKLVKNLILIDVKNDFTYRLVGSEVVARHGLDMTGRRAGSSGKDPNALADWTKEVAYVSRESKPRLLVARIGADAVARHVMILLPLVNGDGEVEIIMVGSFYNEHFGLGTQVAGMTVTEISL